MASTSFLNQFQDLDFTNEEQGAVFTPTIQWDSLNDDSNLLIIGKMISSNPIDDNAVVRAFQGIWKHDKIVSITTVKANYYRIKFPTEDIRNDILSRGPWTFKGDWLALAASNPNYSIDEYSFLSMNVWIRIYGIPSILMDDDDIANHTGNSLGATIGTFVKVDTRRIDLNMVNYLRIGIVLDVTKPVRHCVAIGGSVDATIPMVAIIETHFLAATDPLGTVMAMEPKLVAATIPIAPTVAIANTLQVAGMIPSKGSL
ncbi:hypothetical protein V6N13_114007 [Hibiscus sabdariffa]